MDSRVEDILKSILDGAEYKNEPLSRVEVLLIELGKLIEQGGATPAEIEAAVTKYLDEHPVSPYDDTEIREAISTLKTNLIAISETREEEKTIDISDAVILNMYINPDNTTVTSQTAKTMYIPCEGNKEYIIEKKIDNRFRVATRKTTPVIGENVSNVIVNDNGDVISITTPIDAHYLLIYYYSSVCVNTETELRSSVLVKTFVNDLTALDKVARGLIDSYGDQNISTKKEILQGTRTSLYPNRDAWAINQSTGVVSLMYEVEKNTDYVITKDLSSRFNVALCNNVSVGRTDIDIINIDNSRTEFTFNSMNYNRLLVQVKISSDAIFPNVELGKKTEYNSKDYYVRKTDQSKLIGLNDYLEKYILDYVISKDDIVCIRDTDGVIALYDELVANYPNFVTKRIISTAYQTSDDKPIYEYTFSTGDFNSIVGNREDKLPSYEKKKVLLSSGVHGGEKSAVMALYGFCKKLCENVHSLNILHDSVEFKVIPIVCPYAYDRYLDPRQLSVLPARTNKNGVNINRNFPYMWSAENDGEHNNSGDAPLSEYESKSLMDWFRNNTNALYYMDCHNSGYYSEVVYFAPNPQATDEMIEVFLKGFNEGISLIKERLINERGISESDNIISYVGKTRMPATTTGGANSIGINSIVIEFSERMNHEVIHATNYTIGTSIEVLSSVIKKLTEIMI